MREDIESLGAQRCVSVLFLLLHCPIENLSVVFPLEKVVRVAQTFDNDEISQRSKRKMCQKNIPKFPKTMSSSFQKAHLLLKI